MNKKYLTFGAIAAAVLILAGAGWWWFYGRGVSIADLAGSAQATEIKSTDMVHGNPKAPVTIIEYASMTCPHCAAFQKEVIPLLAKDYLDTGKAKLVFREFPLDAAARMASALARCFSGDQYFNFIDLLFANQGQWWVKQFDNNHQPTKESVEDSLAEMARVAGMGHDMAVACANDPKNLALVDANWKEAMDRYSVDSTPTFIIDGVKHAGEIPYDELKKILDPLVAK